MGIGSAPRHFTLTLTGAAQNLGDIVASKGPGGATSVVLMFSLQPHSSNVNPIFVGDSTLTITDYGVSMEAPTSSVPPAPWTPPEAQLDLYAWSLQDWFVLGTNGEKLHILWVPKVGN